MFPVRPLHIVMRILNLTYLQDKIERMVIDGVADAENYYASQPLFLTSSSVFTESALVSIVDQEPSRH